MAIKIKKKVDRPADDPNAPDQILVATRDTFDWLNERWKGALIFIVALVVLIIVGSFSLQGWQTRNVETSRAFFDTLAMTTVPAGEANASGAAEAAAAAAALREQGIPASSLASLIEASSLLAAGDSAGAATAYEAFLSDFTDAHGWSALFGLAAAQAEQGQVDAALATMDRVMTEAPALAAAALVQSAHLIDAAGDDERALERWQRVLDEHPDAPGADFAEQRLRGLQIALGQLPSAADPGADDQ